MAANVVLIKKIPCPYCERAKTFLENRNIKYTTIDLTDKPDELEKWKQKTGWKTVPMIFINDKLIGGYTDLKTLDEDGQLDALLGM